jgi:hypothetical protein
MGKSTISMAIFNSYVKLPLISRASLLEAPARMEVARGSSPLVWMGCTSTLVPVLEEMDGDFHGKTIGKLEENHGKSWFNMV